MRHGRSGAYPLSSTLKGFSDFLKGLLSAAAKISKSKCSLQFEAVLVAGIAELLKSMLLLS